MEIKLILIQKFRHPVKCEVKDTEEALGIFDWYFFFISYKKKKF